MPQDFEFTEENMITKIAGTERIMKFGTEIILDNCLTPEQQVGLLSRADSKGEQSYRENKQILGEYRHTFPGGEVAYPERLFLGEDFDGNRYSITIESLCPEAKAIHDDRLTARELFKHSKNPEGIYGYHPDSYVWSIGPSSLTESFGLTRDDKEWEKLFEENPSREFYEKAFNGFVGISAKEMQLAAVEKNAAVFKDIKNPDEEVKLLAVQKDGLSIIDIDKPSDELRAIAASQLADSVIAKYFPQSQPSEAAATIRDAEKGREQS